MSLSGCRPKIQGEEWLLVDLISAVGKPKQKEITPSRKAHHGLKIYAAAEKVSMTNPRTVDESDVNPKSQLSYFSKSQLSRLFVLEVIVLMRYLAMTSCPIRSSGFHL